MPVSLQGTASDILTTRFVKFKVHRRNFAHGPHPTLPPTLHPTKMMVVNFWYEKIQAANWNSATIILVGGWGGAPEKNSFYDLKFYKSGCYDIWSYSLLLARSGTHVNIQACQYASISACKHFSMQAFQHASISVRKHFSTQACQYQIMLVCKLQITG